MKFRVDVGLENGERLSFYDYAETRQKLIEKIEDSKSDFVPFYGANDGVRRDKICWYKTCKIDE